MVSEREAGDEIVADPEQGVDGAGRRHACDGQAGNTRPLLGEQGSNAIDVDVDLIVVHLHDAEA